MRGECLRGMSVGTALSQWQVAANDQMSRDDVKVRYRLRGQTVER